MVSVSRQYSIVACPALTTICGARLKTDPTHKERRKRNSKEQFTKYRLPLFPIPPPSPFDFPHHPLLPPIPFCPQSRPSVSLYTPLILTPIEELSNYLDPSLSRWAACLQLGLSGGQNGLFRQTNLCCSTLTGFFYLEIVCKS